MTVVGRSGPNFQHVENSAPNPNGAPGGPGTCEGVPIVADYPRISGAMDANHVPMVFFDLAEEPIDNF